MHKTQSFDKIVFDHNESEMLEDSNDSVSKGSTNNNYTKLSKTFV